MLIKVSEYLSPVHDSSRRPWGQLLPQPTPSNRVSGKAGLLAGAIL